MNPIRTFTRCWIASLFFAFSALAADEGALRLESAAIAVDLDPATGALKRITNKITADTKTLHDEPFCLTTTLGEITAQQCSKQPAHHDEKSADFAFEAKGIQVKLSYRLSDADAGAIRKFLSVTNRTSQEVTLFDVELFNWAIPAEWPSGYPHSYYPGGITDVHFHRSGQWYRNPINLFLRDETGGIFVGIENPIFEASYRCLRKVYPTIVRLSFSPRWIIKPGATFEAEPGFIGCYRQEKVYRVIRARSYFDGRERTPFEILDWGEVWAMQRYMDSIMPIHDSQGGRYPMCYWGYADPGRLGRISRKKEKGETLTAEEQAMLAHFGGGPFNFDDQEIWYRLTPDTVKFYKQVIDDAASLGHYDTLVIPNMMAGHTGWFVSKEQSKQQAEIEQLNDTWFDSPAYGLWQEVADYAAKRDIGMFTLETTGRPYRADRPEWSYLTADGKRTGTRCYANTAYVDWYTDQIDKALTRHPIRYWQWDEGWMGPVVGSFGQDGHCYDESHGHLPGNVHYQQFRHVMSTLERLKSKHPGVRMIIISGLIPGMPWVMKYLDGDSHTGSIEQAAWFDRNDLFLPALKCHREDGIHWLLPRGSASVEPSDTSDWYTMLENPEAKEAFRKNLDRWFRWTREHLDCLRARRDLFAVGGGADGLAGTAYIAKDRGFIFVHNAGKAPAAGRVSLDRLLGLEEGKRFRVREQYPGSSDFGVLACGHTLTVIVKPGETRIVEVEPTTDELADHTPELPPDVPVQKAFLTLEDATRLVEPADLWPAAGLPGRANMPGF